MNKKVLVTYASKYGATREIAERINSVLLWNELPCEVFPVSEIHDLMPYEAVVMGSAIYVGKWPRQAVEFLRTHEKALAGMPFWLFSSGPTGEGDPLKLVEGKRLPDDVLPVVQHIHPREITVFHGNIDPDKVNFIERWAIKSLVKKPFGDYRDWDSIVDWSNRIAAALKHVEPVVAA